MKKYLFSIFLVILMCVPLLPRTINEMNPQTTMVPRILADTSHSVHSGFTDFSNYVLIASFEINSNSDFQLYSSSGNGSEQDPYIIENYYISTTSTSWVRDTTSNFIIRNCVFSPSGTRGIAFDNVANGVIDECWFTEGGIYLEDSDNVTISNCWLREHNIKLQNCLRCNITSNIVHAWDSDDLGIEVHTSYGGNSEIRIEDNIVSGFYRGIWNSATHYTQILDNSVYRNSGTGIYTWDGSQNCEVHNNRIGWTGACGAEHPSNNFTGNYWSDYDGEGSHTIIMGSDDNPSIWVDNQYPDTSHPTDFEYHWTEAPGKEISWIVYDSYPHSFEIEEDNTVIASGIWDIFPITLTLGDLEIGNHNFTLILYDAAGNRAEDTVIVSILPDNHGLEWGVSVNQTMSFSLQAEKEISGTTTQDQKSVIIEIGGFDSLPGKSDYIPYASALAYEGATGEWFDLSSYFTGNQTVLSLLAPAVAIGNWSLLSDLAVIEYVSFNPEIIDSSGQWGIDFNYTIGDTHIHTWTKWFKSDGSLEEIYLRVVNEETGYAEVTLSRTGVLPDTVPIMIGIAAIISIVAVVVVFKKRRIS